jgi:hypothetical protein
VKKDKAEQLDKVFKHLKQGGDPKGLEGVDPALVAVLSKLDAKERQALAKLNDDLFDAGFGVSGEFRVSMV